MTKPEIIKTKFSRVMSLRDGLKKMSKSDTSDNSRINLTDQAEDIYNKIKKSKTDMIPTIKYDENRPEVSNLIQIYSEITNISI